MKSLLTLSLSFIFIPGISYAAFSDVPTSHPYYEGVSYLSANNIVNGYDDQTFRPDNRINRAEFLKIVLEATGQANSNCTQNIDFTDVPDDAWYKDYVMRGVCLNIVKGYEDLTFRAGNDILFTEAAKIIVEGFDLPTTPTDPWYAPYTNALSNAKAIPTSIESFAHPLTRGEMAELIFRIKTNNTQKPSNSLFIKIEPEITIQPRDTNFGDGPITPESLRDLINQARDDLNIAPVTINDTLQNIAQDYAQKMDDEDFFDHLDPQGKSPAQRAKDGGYSYRFIAENIAKGQSSTPEVFDVWKNSPGHWANIINADYEEMGVGRTEETNDPRFSGFVWVLIMGAR